MSKYEMHLAFTEQLKQFTKGIRRTVADKKKVEGDSNIIGKKKIDFNVYQLMCELFMMEEGEEFIFVRSFLTLEWNLMAQSENVVHAHMFHITWENDCLVFHFVKVRAIKQVRTVIKRGMSTQTQKNLLFVQCLRWLLIFLQILAYLECPLRKATMLW
jgi:hypothetical protein